MSRVLEKESMLASDSSEDTPIDFDMRNELERMVRIKPAQECAVEICVGDSVYHRLEPQIIGTVEVIHTELNRLKPGTIVNPNCGKDFVF